MMTLLQLVPDHNYTLPRWCLLYSIHAVHIELKTTDASHRRPKRTVSIDILCIDHNTVHSPPSHSRDQSPSPFLAQPARYLQHLVHSQDPFHPISPSCSILHTLVSKARRSSSFGRSEGPPAVHFIPFCLMLQLRVSVPIAPSVGVSYIAV